MGSSRKALKGWGLCCLGGTQGACQGGVRASSCHDSGSVVPGQGPGLCLKGMAGGVAQPLLEPLAWGVFATHSPQTRARPRGLQEA